MIGVRIRDSMRTVLVHSLVECYLLKDDCEVYLSRAPTLVSVISASPPGRNAEVWPTHLMIALLYYGRFRGPTQHGVCKQIRSSKLHHIDKLNQRGRFLLCLRWLYCCGLSGYARAAHSSAALQLPCQPASNE